MASERRSTANIDERCLVATLFRLARVPTDVPLGFNTLMGPDDPKLVHYVQDIVRPELTRIGVYDPTGENDATGARIRGRLAIPRKVNPSRTAV